MTLVGWMMYAFVISLLLGSAAWLLAAGTVRAGVPTRWVWLGALLLCLGLPILAPIRQPELASIGSTAVRLGTGSSESSTETASGGITLVGIGAIPRALHRGLDDVNRLLALGGGAKRSMGLAWISASLFMALATVGAMLRLGRRARLRPPEEVLGRCVRVTTDLGPATIGLLRPEIVIPNWVRRLALPELELVLRHEEEHARKRDPLLLTIALLPILVTPWNPVLWWLRRRLRDAVEMDCDRRVLDGGVGVARYADLLFRLGSTGPGTTLAPTMAGSPPLLERRLSAMRHDRRRAALPRAVACVTLSLALVAVACGTTPPQSDEEPVDVRTPVATTQQAETQSRDDDLARLRAALEEVEGRGGVRVEVLEASPSARESAELRAILTDLIEARSELRALRDRYNDDYPPIRELLADIQAMETVAIPRALRGIIAELERQTAGPGGRL